MKTLASALTLSALLGFSVVHAETPVTTEVPLEEKKGFIESMKGALNEMSGVVKETAGDVAKVTKAGENTTTDATDGESEEVTTTVAEGVAPAPVTKPVPAASVPLAPVAPTAPVAPKVIPTEPKAPKAPTPRMEPETESAKDSEATRKTSDVSVAITSQNAYIQSIMEKTTHIKPQRLHELLTKGEKITLLDVRPAEEAKKTKGIHGTRMNIPRNFLEVDAYEKLPNFDARIIVYSSKGIRGGLAAHTLQDMGYTNVRNLIGGLQGWNALAK